MLSQMIWKRTRQLIAAVMPDRMAAHFRRMREKQARDQKYAAFWKRNSRANLERHAIDGMSKPPPVPTVIQQRAPTNLAVDAISYADQCGLLEFLSNDQGGDLGMIVSRFGFGDRQVRALMDLLEAAGIVVREAERYTTTPSGRVYLLPDSPFYMGDQFQKSWITDDRMRRKMPAGPVAKWDTGEAHDPEHWGWNQHGISFKLGFALGSTGLLDSDKKILDVAGGAGSVCIALALKYPAIKATVLELPQSTDVARKMIARYDLADRIECIGEDMFTEEWPGGFDAVLFTNIFHDWDLEKCQTLAHKAYSCLRPGGRVLVQEALLAEDEPGPVQVSAYSLRMALEFTGQQFRGSHLNEILSAAGFNSAKGHELFGDYWTVVADRD